MWSIKKLLCLFFGTLLITLKILCNDFTAYNFDGSVLQCVACAHHFTESELINFSIQNQCHINRISQCGTNSSQFSGVTISSDGLSWENPVGLTINLCSLVYQWYKGSTSTQKHSPSQPIPQELCSCSNCPCVSHTINRQVRDMGRLYSGQLPTESSQPPPVKQPQHNDGVQKVFRNSVPELETYIPTSHCLLKERNNAYQKTLENNCATHAATYSLSARTQQFLTSEQISFQSLQLFSGNDFQHQLHHEIITGIEIAAYAHENATTDTTKDFSKQITHSFTDAHITNSLGQCATSIRIIDMCISYLKVLFWCGDFNDITVTAHAMASFGKGFVCHGLETLWNIVCHPLETVQELAIGLATTLQNIGYYSYEPQLPTHNDLINQETRERYLQRYLKECEIQQQRRQELVATTRQICHTLYTTVTTMPAYEFAEKSGGLCADILIYDAYFKGLASVSKVAYAQAKAGVISSVHSLKHLAKEFPALGFVRSIEQTKNIVQAAQLAGIPEAITLQGLTQLEKSYPGSLEATSSALQEISHIPDLSEKISTTIARAAGKEVLQQELHTCKLLEYATDLERSGEKIIGIRCPLMDGESVLSPLVFDVVTETQAIHYIDQSLPSLDLLKPLESVDNVHSVITQRRLLQQRQLAQSIDKTHTICFHEPISRPWADWLTENKFAYTFRPKIELENYLAHIISPAEWEELYAYAKEFSFIHPLTGETVKPAIDLKHIFLPEVEWFKNGTCRIKGMHHDYQKIIASERFITIEPSTKFIMNHGCEAVDIIYNNFKKPSTLFPCNWYRKKVIEQIQEALGSVIRSEEEGIKTNFWGKTEQGLKIEIIYNKKTNTIETAFPTLFK